MNIYDYLIVTNDNYKFSEKDKQIILKNFIRKFVDKELIEKYILYWNSIRSEYRIRMRRLDLEEINKMKIMNADNLYIYLERNRELFKGNIQIILDFFEQQEPWEDTDIIVFDKSYDWFIAFTHEDEVIFVE